MSDVNAPVDSLFLAAVPIRTLAAGRHLSDASGFFFRRDDRLFLVTSRHVMIDELSAHFPDAISVELHTSTADLAVYCDYTVPLYENGEGLWRQGFDSAGDIDVAVVELDAAALPPSLVHRAFTPRHLPRRFEDIEAGSSVLIVGFPLGFYDTLHHMPVVRHAVIASSYGLRFKGEGYFLTDARTHRGSSGAPVVMRVAHPDKAVCKLPWLLLGIHSARLDVGNRDLLEDEALGLNIAWYSDILMTLTD